MENSLLKYYVFVKTVEKGSFTRAAQSLNYAQSSVSKMIADLERETGAVLLERNRSGVCLTSVGEQLLPYFRKLLNDFDDLDGAVSRINGIKSGVVRIGTFSSVAIHLLPGIFAEIQKDYPGIEFEMLLGDYKEIEGWIDEGRVDCGFLSLPVKTDYTSVTILKDEYKVVLPAEHPLAEKEKIMFDDLQGCPFLLLEHGGKTEVSDLLEKHNIRPDVRFTTWEDFAVMAMAEKGLGIGILPEIILRRNPFNIAVRPLEEPYLRYIAVAMKKNRTMPPAAEVFLEYLTASVPGEM